MKKGGSKSKLGRCLGAPMRALSRACESACDLYVRGMSRCAHLVPVEGVVLGRGFGRSATTMHLRVSSDRGEDLVRAASKQRRVAAEPADVAAVKKGGLCLQAPAVPARKKGAAMGTIAEDAPCEFVADGACALKAPAPRRRGAGGGRLGGARRRV